MFRCTALVFATICVLGLSAARERTTDAADLLQVTSRVTYDIRPDAGPVRVAWEVSFTNNDPSTGPRADGTIAFYESAFLPVLRGASSLAARSSGGTSLNVTVKPPDAGPIAAATVTFGKRLFYQETYDFTMSYEVPQIREHSLLVTPVYAYIPAVASGDAATVTINTPPDGPWKTNLESSDCEQNAGTFNCSGSDSVYLAALAEVSRPDATASMAFDVPLRERALSVKLTYFQGEDESAQHLKELTTAGLPLIEELYGFPHSGPPTLNISHGGRQQILGYEGLTSCMAISSCDVIVSPVADDLTVLHELAHLWSDIYARRWLSEGFAQLVAEEAAARLPAGFVQGEPTEREQASVDLQLDEWGDVTSIIGASEEEVGVQNSGYDRSLRFMYILRQELGLTVLQQANAATAMSGEPADSLRYLDRLEDAGGKILDSQFGEWVFTRDFGLALTQRRQARDRLQNLERTAMEEELSGDIPKAIRGDVEAHRFPQALAALDQAEAGLAEYEALKEDVAAARSTAEAAGLSMPDTILAMAKSWKFEEARSQLATVVEAIGAYQEARAKVQGSRNLWEQFGLLGRDPDKTLERAADAFAEGDFDSAVERADAAARMVEGASNAAFQRLLVVAAVLAVFAAGIGAAAWWSRVREKEFAEG